jgi:hypothetical protein
MLHTDDGHGMFSQSFAKGRRCSAIITHAQITNCVDV